MITSKKHIFAFYANALLCISIGSHHRAFFNSSTKCDFTRILAATTNSSLAVVSTKSSSWLPLETRQGRPAIVHSRRDKADGETATTGAHGKGAYCSYGGLQVFPLLKCFLIKPLITSCGGTPDDDGVRRRGTVSAVG
jgi:hypothetical protein